MKRSIIPDTNIFLRFILKDVPSQARIAKKLFRDAEAGKINIFVPQIIIFEIQFILNKYYLLSRKLVAEKLEKIVLAPFYFVQDRQSLLAAIGIYREKNISFVDSFLKAICENKNFKLLSFDKFDDLGG